MEQAKLRGTLEQRATLASRRNEQLLRDIEDKPELKKYAAQHSLQRLAAKLVAAQLTPSMLAIQVAVELEARQHNPDARKD